MRKRLCVWGKEVGKRGGEKWKKGTAGVGCRRAVKDRQCKSRLVCTHLCDEPEHGLHRHLGEGHDDRLTDGLQLLLQLLLAVHLQEGRGQGGRCCGKTRAPYLSSSPHSAAPS